MNMRLGWGMSLVVAGLLLAGPVVAEEVVIRNDGLNDFGQGYVVGDFATGEHAGVRLTTPYNGNIVAIQILWLSATGGAQQSIEDGIHIYADGGAFPTPGTELVMLEGPVLTPGSLNEFRTIDENGTPLSVPVTAGQSFFVTLQFYNATDIAHGSASIVRDLDGCQPQRNVLKSAFPLNGWFDFCSFISGDVVIRAVVNRAGATGACCLTDGSCMDNVEQSACATYGAVWAQGVTCAQVTCTGRGACCRAGGCLKLTTEANCLAIGGVYAGHGTNCADNVCVTGACCSADGSCAQNFPFQCTAAGGVYHGAGTTCTPNPCPQPSGACCFGTTCLPDQLAADCAGAGGVWKGAGSVCTPNPCGPTLCLGDGNCDGTINWRDIDYLVAGQNDNQSAWQALFAGTPPCAFLNLDTNTDSHVNWRDIDPFIARMNTTCH